VDLEADPGETRRVAAEHPGVVKKLLALAEDMRADLGDHDRVGKNMRFFDPLEKRPEKPMFIGLKRRAKPKEPKK
ncbi:MAG: hypothetical protein GY880_27705, partial [Planctomycetaceae bacterium]|nr:hypothetical protein [Planctomycetaceae bacterium]